MCVFLQSRAVITWDIFLLPQGWQTQLPHPTCKPENQSPRLRRAADRRGACGPRHPVPRHKPPLYFSPSYFPFFCIPRDFNKRLNCKRRKICKTGHLMAPSWLSAQNSVYSLLMCFRLGQPHVQRPVSLCFSKQSEWEQEKTTAVAGSVCCPGTASLSWQREVWTSFSKHDGSLLASDWKSGNERLQLPISYLLRQRNRIKYILGPSAVFHGIACLSIGLLSASHHCHSPGFTCSSSNAAVPLVAHNEGMNFLINSSSPKHYKAGWQRENANVCCLQRPDLQQAWAKQLVSHLQI